MNSEDQKTSGYIGDSAVIDKLFRRDENGLKEASKAYEKGLLHFSSRFLKDERDREEALSDTYLRLWNSIPPTRPHSLKAYLYTLTRRSCIDLLRKKAKEERVCADFSESLEELSEVLPDTKDTEDEVMARELGRAISAFLKKQDARDRRIFLKRYFEACPVKETAEELGVSTSTVEKALKRLRMSLKDYLESEGYGL